MSKKTKKILGMCGSLRSDSYNSKLLKFSLERLTSRVKHCEHFIANLNLEPINFTPENQYAVMTDKSLLTDDQKKILDVLLK